MQISKKNDKSKKFNFYQNVFGFCPSQVQTKTNLHEENFQKNDKSKIFNFYLNVFENLQVQTKTTSYEVSFETDIV